MPAPVPDAPAAAGAREEDLGAAARAAALRLLACTDTGTLLTLLLDACLARVGGDRGALYVLRDDGRLRLAACRGYSAELQEQFATVSPHADLPAPRAVRERRPVFMPAEYFRPSYPEVADFGEPLAYVCFPLLADDRCLGAVMLRTPPQPPTGAEERDLNLLTAVGAHRLEHLLSLGDATPPGGAPRLGQTVRRIDTRSRGARLRLAVSSADIGFFDWDFATGRVVWDEPLCRIYGVSPQEFDERVESFFRVLHPADRPGVEQELNRALRTGKFSVTHRVVHPGGQLRWVKAEGRVLHDADDRPQGMLGIVQDRTEEHRRYVRDTARREFLLSVTRAITGAFSTQEVIDTAAAMVLPTLGARHIIVYVGGDTGGLAVAATHGFDAAELAALEAQVQEVPHDPELLTALERRPLFCETRADYQAVYSAGLPRLPGQEAWAILPLITAEGPVGTCVISFDRPHVFTKDDEALCIAAAGVLAQAVGRSRLTDERRRQMTELQRLMLPSTIPELPGLEIAARYLPGSKGLEVGGDWYDVVPGSDGRVMVVVGDVQGHSAQAAAVMGHVRVAMRVHARDETDPAELLVRGNDILCEVDTDRYATCVAVQVSAARDRVRVARAGHAYPLLIEPGGRVREVEVPGGVPMGCFDAQEYPVAEETLLPGATLVLYTDGLVERRGEDLGDSLAELMRSLAEWSFEEPAPGTAGERRPRDLNALADRVVASVGASPAQDDIALLLLRRTGPGPAR
ncbi:SpoIIE family protein phosphatase [Streptomyces pactum]|uniref:SpoIIE family protein phosphatase n=1 Tax=Streptomyces pactum TaxID=68249 RepID=A0ABS0NME4_9ACTN|nr:SpoIIE family protein phosphatase [Streptomyces pactum]MBH5336360.1 SpoIIE family protein phosphatase [Streptomyces pactum]